MTTKIAIDFAPESYQKWAKEKAPITPPMEVSSPARSQDFMPGNEENSVQNMSYWRKNIFSTLPVFNFAQFCLKQWLLWKKT